jgi:hypothetical protein
MRSVGAVFFHEELQNIHVAAQTRGKVSSSHAMIHTWVHMWHRNIERASQRRLEIRLPQKTLAGDSYAETAPAWEASLAAASPAFTRLSNNIAHAGRVTESRWMMALSFSYNGPHVFFVSHAMSCEPCPPEDSLPRQQTRGVSIENRSKTSRGDSPHFTLSSETSCRIYGHDLRP